MSHGKDAARDLRYGRRGGGWDADRDGRSIAELRADHLAEHPDGCRTGCAWCDERAGRVPSLFDTEVP